MSFLDWLRLRREKECVAEAQQEPIISIKPIDSVDIKVNELCEFVGLAVKFANREIIAVGIGTYEEAEKKAKVTGIYPVLNAPGSKAGVNLDWNVHHELDQALEHWHADEEIAVFHTHPGFSSFKSGIDDGHGIRMAAILFGGKAVMCILDPLSARGIDIATYALDPSTKVVKRIPFRLVP